MLNYMKKTAMVFGTTTWAFSSLPISLLTLEKHTYTIEYGYVAPGRLDSQQPEGNESDNDENRLVRLLPRGGMNVQTASLHAAKISVSESLSHYEIEYVAPGSL
jgi:hypothetical protein